MKAKIFSLGIGSLLIFLLVLSTHGVCQHNAADSLISLLKTKSGPERVDLLFETVWAYNDMENDQEGLHYARQGFDLALQLGDTARIVKLGRAKAQFLRRVSQIDSASMLLHKLIPIATRHHLNSELAAMLNSLGLIHQTTGKYDKALAYLFDALSLREMEGNASYISGVLNNIGLVYYAIPDYEKALSFYQRAVQKKKEANDLSGLDLFYSNIGLCYTQMRDFAQAKIYINDAISSCGNSCSKKTLTYVSHCRGIISFYEGNFSKAETALLEAYRVCLATDDKRYLLYSIDYLVRIYTAQNRLIDAERYLKEVDAIVSTGAPYNAELSNIYEQGIKLYRSRDLEKMSLYQDKYIALIDNVFNEELTTNLMKVEAEHLEKENLAKLESQNKILALNAEVIRTHKLLNVSIGLVAVLLIVLIIVLLKSNRHKQKHNVLLDKKVQERTHQLQLNHDSLQRASQEREIVLEKISTDINNALSTLKGLCSLGMKDIKDPHALEYISKMNTTSESFSNILTKLHFIRSGAGTLK